MFAGAAREAVFSNRDVVRRVNEEFIPVALKASRVNNPPGGAEGRIYAEIGRSKPAPQGICVVNSAGRVLAWSLMFDDDPSVLAFLDHCRGRYEESPDKALAAERYMRFPSERMDDVDAGGKLEAPERHGEGDRCVGKVGYPEGALLCRIYGRAFKDGKPVEDAKRQEHYAEDRFEVPLEVQEMLAGQTERFRLPDPLSRALVASAYLGQLDVNPLADNGGRQDRNTWEFWGRREGDVIRIEGKSDLAAGADDSQDPRSDGRMWEHSVKLSWRGVIELKDRRVARLQVLAEGREKLRWGNARMIDDDRPAVSHLPGGRPIDLECDVRYGIVGAPVPPELVGPGDASAGPPDSLQRKMRRLQDLVGKRRRKLQEVSRIMERFEPLVREGRFEEAEAVLDEALSKLGE